MKLQHHSFCVTASTTKRSRAYLPGKMILFLLCVFMVGQARSQTTAAFQASGAFFALSVKDLEASSKWYAEKLGMKITMQLPKQDKTSVAVLEGGGLIVELIQNDDAMPLSTAAPSVSDNILVHGFFKAGLIVDDLDKLVALFRERNVEIAYGPFTSRADQRSNVIIKYNSGNLIQFFGK